MDQNLGGNGMRSADQGNEDASEAREHVRNVEENREALEAQSRRVEETAPPELTGTDRGGTGTGGRTGGMSAAGTGQDQGSEDPSAAREHVRNAEENRDALEAQNRRVEATAPEETNRDLRDQR